MKKLFIYSNNTGQSELAKQQAAQLLKAEGFDVDSPFSEDTDMIIVFGGDGAFLQAQEACGYPQVPALGINTGHLGFFQELGPDDTDLLLTYCKEGGFALQPYRLLRVDVETENGVFTDHALNDILVKDSGAGVIKLDLSIGDNMVEKFYGDGIIVASSAGSTGYNYSLKGCIVDPRLEALQLTPCAPINNQVYRTFSSSLLFPPSLDIKVRPVKIDEDRTSVFADGREIHRGAFMQVTIALSDRRINVVRNKDYDFWSKVQSKFL